MVGTKPMLWPFSRHDWVSSLSCAALVTMTGVVIADRVPRHYPPRIEVRYRHWN